LISRRSTTPSTRRRRNWRSGSTSRGSKSTIELKPKENVIELVADDNFKMDAVWEIVQTRLHRRGVPTKNLKLGDIETIGGGPWSNVRWNSNRASTRMPRARSPSFVKERKLKKVQVTIQGDQLRVTSGSKDELQNAIHLLRAEDFGIELQFGNFRE
jgi:uncharacterized protein YajQ (UPF0234 family)